MTATLMSADQILSEAARQVRAVATDPVLRGADPVSAGLEQTMVTASSTTHAVEAVMSLKLELAHVSLPRDLARSVSYCEEVSDEVGAVLTALHAACASVRAQILEAVKGEATGNV